MPIRPENRARYPRAWPAIAASIRDRATLRASIAEAFAELERDAARYAEALSIAKDAHQHATELAARNSALGLDVLDMSALMRRLIAGVAHLSEVARQWEPDHSSGADRARWVKADEAKRDAERFLAEQAERIAGQSADAAIAAAQAPTTAKD